MPTTAKTLSEVARTAQAPLEGQSRLRTQAAWVRTLSDELKRYESAGHRFVALREQLREEVANLASLEEAATPEPPASGIRLRSLK
jgi:hypothetical protein